MSKELDMDEYLTALEKWSSSVTEEQRKEYFAMLREQIGELARGQ